MLGMQLSMGQYQTQELQQKQELNLEITIEQYLNQEEIIKELIRYVNENSKWKKFDEDGFNFQYGAVPYDIAKPIAEIAGPGFAHCHCIPFGNISRADWTLFVVEDMIPDWAEKYVAMHERGEELSLGNHYLASQLEFAKVRKDKKVRDYNELIEEIAPTKFVDLNEKVLFPVLPIELDEELEKNNWDELEIAQALVIKYPLPKSTINKVEKYNELTQQAYESIVKPIGEIQSIATNFRNNHQVKELAEYLNHFLYNTFNNLTDTRHLSIQKMNQALELFNRTTTDRIYQDTNQHIIVETDYIDLLKKIEKNEQLAYLK